ncbi:pyridoxamine 5'-phosphate oxidase family protein [Sphingobium cupriresistens]|uniref:pyridoxamine 5'-phosphate oxidase family protein n=1 Tax=Sphingobium cupriresistens TaxID=1132417 RepID=UPI003BADE67E
MSQRTIRDLAQKMKDIDFAMLSTHAPDGAIGSRPMSNNRDVDYDGDSWFFTTDDSQMATDIGNDPKVGLSFQGKAGMLGMRPFFIAIEGQAELIRDKGAFEAHWTKDLDRWFEQGVDTPGLLLIKVHATSAHYWDGEDEGEVLIDRGVFVGGP